MKEIERSSDVLDQASELTDFLTEAAVNERRALAAPESHRRFDGLHCVEEDCGVEIPEARLKHGKVRCVDCQEIIEKQHKTDRRI